MIAPLTRVTAPYSAAPFERIRQQDAIATLVRATHLAVDDQQVLELAARISADALGADRCEILECGQDGTLRLRAETTRVAHRSFAMPEPGRLESAAVRQLGAVIASREGPFGLLRAHAPNGSAFRRPDLDFAQRVADIVSAELERRRVQRVAIDTVGRVIIDRSSSSPG